MLKLIWHSTTIKTNKEANEMVKLFRELKPTIGGFDTETNGLHITSAKPFLFQFGFIHPNLKEGYTYAVDIETQPSLSIAVIKAWNKLAEGLEVYFAHNIKFDLHMLQNLGEPYTKENVSDTMFYIRYGHDAVTEDNGGPPLALKKYAAKYIDRYARYHERQLDAEKSEIVKDLHNKLKFRLNNCRANRSYTLAVIKDMFKDCTTDYTELEEPVKSAYMDWLTLDVPIYIQDKVTSLVDTDMIPYNKLNRENLITYAHYDIIYMLEIYLKLKPSVEARDNMKGIEFENSLIYPFLEMERTGFSINKEYLEESRIKLKNYIRQQRSKLYELAGREFSISQHKLIKEIYLEQFGVPLLSTDKNELSLLVSNLKREGGHNSEIKFIALLQELRTLEKWYSTYIVRFLKDLKLTNKLYTTIHQVGTVTGRISSDFQQFPKDGIKTVDGEEIFKPRKMVKPSGGDYNGIVYLDFSQIELRFQAFYTILVGHPDTNLCRAYMPYNCVNPNGRVFDYTSYSDICNWESHWYYQEDVTKHWEPTDVHGATASYATGLTVADGDAFSNARKNIGKRVNFAKQVSTALTLHIIY